MSIKLLNLELFELKFAHERYKTYMLFDGWEVRMVKNCDRGLENAARGPQAAFLSPKSQFFTIRTDPKPANNMLIFSCSKLVLQVTNGFVYAALVIESACAPSTICKKSWQRTSNSDSRQRKMY